MSTTEEIESAVSELPPDELGRFRAWFERFEADSWKRNEPPESLEAVERRLAARGKL